MFNINKDISYETRSISEILKDFVNELKYKKDLLNDLENEKPISKLNKFKMEINENILRINRLKKEIFEMERFNKIFKSMNKETLIKTLKGLHPTKMDLIDSKLEREMKNRDLFSFIGEK